MRKIKWANSKEGLRWTKKEMGKAQDIVRGLTEKPKESTTTTWKEKSPQENLMRLSIDLNKLIGKDFKHG